MKKKMRNFCRAAMELARRGFAVFPIKAGGKTPAIKNWVNEATQDEGIIARWWGDAPSSNIGISCGPSGKIVIDLDTKNGYDGVAAFRALLGEEFASVTKTLTVGTPSGGRQLFYDAPEGMIIKNSAGLLGPGIDVRGMGGCVVAPPSFTEGKWRWDEKKGRDVQSVWEGEYCWLNDAPIAPLPAALLELIMKAEANHKATDRKHEAALGIPEGQRNDTLFKLACRLRADGTSYDEAQRRVLEAAAGCIPPLEEKEALECLKSAWRYPGPIEKLNEEHATVMLGGKFAVLTERIDPTTNYPKITFSSPNDFKYMYLNRSIIVRGKTISLGEYWLKNPNRRQYHGVVFAPCQDLPDFFNLWRGFAVEPKEGDCSLYLKLIENLICRGDDALYRYVIAWLADAVQRPAERPGVAIVLRGKQGVGKGVFVQEFGKIYGPHFKHLNKPHQLVGNFNGHMSDALIVYADEAVWAGDKAAEGALKALITEERLPLELKGRDIVMINNHVRLILSSNNEWVVPAGPEERRFLILDVDDQKIQDSDYFAGIVDQMNHGGREALFHFLLNFDLSGINLRNIPATPALEETKLRSMDSVQKFFYEKLQQGALLDNDHHWRCEVPCGELHDNYIRTVAKTGQRRRSAETEMGMGLNKLVPSLRKKRTYINGRLQYCWLFPRLEECRISFEKFMRMKIKWADDEGTFDKPSGGSPRRVAKV